MQVERAEPAPRPAWVKIQGDDYEATVSLRTFAACPSSLLAGMVELELEKAAAGRAPEQPPTVRLDCSAEVAKEVVAVLRQGRQYEPPTDQPRLLKALQVQLDYLGVPAPSVPLTGPLHRQEVVVVPSYWYMGLNYELNPNIQPQQAGLLMYSASTRGWANRTGSQDPRPSELRGDMHPHSGGGCWLASVLKAEATGAGEDLAYCVPNKLLASERYGDSGVLLRASLAAGSFSMPPVHRRAGFSDGAMAAAQGKLYLLGGSCHLEVSPCTPLEVYDPHLDSWFTTRSPVSGAYSLSEHTLVANQQEGMLLALGGSLTSGDRRHRQRPPNDQLLMFDINAGKWTVNPSGCTWPAAATSYSCSGVAVDPYTILVLTAQHSDRSGAHAVRTCLLDLRTWRWRAGASLACHTAPDEEESLLNMGVVAYDNRVLAIGGRRYWNGDRIEWSTPKCHGYSLATDSWSEMPELPFAICHASPVVMRVPSVL